MSSDDERRRKGDRLVVLANQVTLMRLVLVACLAAVVAMADGSIGTAAVFLVAVVWLTDLVDGPLARLGQRWGGSARPEGQVLDPVVDDFAYAVGFIVLYGEGMVPLGFVALVAAVRCSFTLIRIAGLAQGRPFARPRQSGKVMGACLGVGQLVFFAAAAWAPAVVDGDLRVGLTWAMSVVCLVAFADFVIVNRAVIADAIRQPQALGATRQSQMARMRRRLGAPVAPSWRSAADRPRR